MFDSSPRLSRRELARLLPALSLLATAARPARAENAVWSMATEYPSTTVSGEGISYFASRLASETAAHIVVTPSYDAMAGMKSSEIVAAVRDGRLSAGCAFAGALGGIDPLFLLSSLPFVAASEADARRLFDRARTLYALRFQRENQGLLYAAPWPASGLWSRKPIATPADLAGLRIRVYDATSLDVFTTAGARPVNLSFSETMPRLGDGSLDAVLSSGDGGAGQKLWQHLPHFAEIGYAVPLSFATLNYNAYQRLSPNLRGAVDRAALATQYDRWTSWQKRVEDNRNRLRANNVVLTAAAEINPDLKAALAKAASGAIAKWKQSVSPEAAALI
ncbi:MAG TPA: TRAP transporter substrate-binding protein [Reyranella sp.]|nr:TRAP transporter substrate-binding protein [Reyranella sp.]